MTDIRVTREALEVLTNLTTTPNVNVTREALEVLTSLALGGGEASPIRRTINVSYM